MTSELCYAWFFIKMRAKELILDRTHDRLPSVMKWVLLTVVLIWGTISSVQIFRSALSEDGGNDLYTYWYAGLHIRQGRDPYQAFLQGQHPQVPIWFLDGRAVDRDQIVIPDLQPAPGLTLPLILLVTPLAFLNFSSAKLAWFALLSLTNFLIPFLLLRAIHGEQKISKIDYLLFTGIFLGFSATRYATISGQPSIFVIALMLLAWIWAKERPALSGILLGFALSKYSLALGFWIYFTLVERRPKLSLSAAGVQVVGLLGLAWLGGSTVSQAIDGYIQLFLHHAPMEGIQLTSLLPGINAYSPSLAIALSLFVGLPTAVVLFRLGWSKGPIESTSLLRTTFLTLLSFWSLMVAYHRAYDLQLFLLLAGLNLLIQRSGSDLDRRIRILSSVYTTLAILVLSLPAGGLLRSWLPAELGSVWIRTILRASTWVIVIGLGWLITLLFHLAGRHPARIK